MHTKIVYLKTKEGGWMSETNPVSRIICGVLIAAAGLLLLAAPAQAQVKRKSFQDLVQESDAIFIANCTERESVMEGGRIVTRYKLKPNEFWKGSLKLDKDGQIPFDEIGGILKGKVPIGTTVPG